jgi:hypothetical protein
VHRAGRYVVRELPDRGVFFTGSPCAVWANFSGRLYGDTATLSMVVGPCGLSEVTLQH